MMEGRAFVDTNILLRAIIPRMELHYDAEALVQRMWADDIELWISRQVLREFLVQATHPDSFRPSLTQVELGRQIETINSLFRIADETKEVSAHLWGLIRNHRVSGRQVHDANIVATMLVFGIDTLLTHNRKDFERYSELIRIVPLIGESLGDT